MTTRRVLVLSLIVCLAACSDEDKKKVNEQCAGNTDCASDICYLGICASTDPQDNGQPCAGNGNCRSYSCVNTVCIPGTGAADTTCRFNEECSSTVCTGGKCGPDMRMDGGPPDSGPDLTAPDRGSPDGPSPDLAQADAPVPDAPATQLDICPCPDVTAPDLPVPDFPAPDMPVPDMMMPDQLPPDMPVPDMMAPDQKVPDMLQPDTAPGYTILDPNGIQLTKSGMVHSIYLTPTAASAAGGTLVAWKESGGRVHGALVSKSGALVNASDTVVYSGIDTQQEPAAASDGKGYLVVWNTNLYLMGMLVDSAGKPGASPFQIHSKNPSTAPAVVFDGAAYLVVWSGELSGVNKDIKGRRVDTSGNLLGSAAFTITSPGVNTFPRVANDGTTSLVVWHQLVGGSTYDLWGRAIGAGGTVLGAQDTALCSAANSQLYPTVAAGKTDLLVVWEDNRASTSAEVYGARFKVSTVGAITRVDATDIKFASTNNALARPMAAHDGKNYLVAWADRPTIPLSYGIFGARLLPSGVVLDSTPMVISNPANDQRAATVVFDGANYLAAWYDKRTAQHIYGARIKP